MHTQYDKAKIKIFTYVISYVCYRLFQVCLLFLTGEEALNTWKEEHSSLKASKADDCLDWRKSKVVTYKIVLLD